MKATLPPVMNSNQAPAVSRTLIYLSLTVVLLRLLSLGLYPLMDMTEARYSEIARLMIELDDWVTPHFDYSVPFWGKPPLSIWVTAISFKLFGINEFAARLPHWIAGLLVVWIAWGMAIRSSARLAIYVSALLVGSLLFLSSAGTVMTDMVMLVGTTMAMRGFWFGLHGPNEHRQRERWLLFIGLGIGLLAKGPIALLLSFMPITLWAIMSGNIALTLRGLPWVRGGLITLIIALPWYALAELRSPGFLNYFLIGEHWHRFLTPGWTGDLYGNAHNYARGSIWIFLLLDLLPWTVLLPVFFVIEMIKRKPTKAITGDVQWTMYLCLWALAPAVFFTFARNILWPYVLPGFPALALLAGAWLERHSEPRRAERLLAIGLVTISGVLIAVIAAMHFTGINEDKSQKALVAEYHALKRENEALIYLGEREFSAAFYSQGHAQFVTDASALVRQLEHASAYVAIRNEQINTLPAQLQNSLVRISRHGRFTIFLARRD
jgi:4-amino-4-deoxy-L-arabinose transferase-like glycosyltransferase